MNLQENERLDHLYAKNDLSNILALDYYMQAAEKDPEFLFEQEKVITSPNWNAPTEELTIHEQVREENELSPIPNLDLDFSVVSRYKNQSHEDEKVS